MTDWPGIQSTGFTFPVGADVDELLSELVDMLASPDAQIRDDFAYTAAARWIADGVVPDDRLVPLGDQLMERFQADEIQARSFAALVLDVIVATRDVCEPRWVDAFEQWYAAEQDLRGYDSELGWVHAVAHGADLLGDLGRRADVDPRRMLDLAAARMLAPADQVWRDQEHDRLALAIGKVLARQDLSADDASEWLDPVSVVVADGQPGAVPVPVSNTLHTLRTVYLVVSRGVRVGRDEVLAVPHRDELLDRIAAVLHPATPWMW